MMMMKGRQQAAVVETQAVAVASECTCDDMCVERRKQGSPVGCICLYLRLQVGQGVNHLYAA